MMRFQKIPRDRATEVAIVGKWRPPHYVCSPGRKADSGHDARKQHLDPSVTRNEGETGTSYPGSKAGIHEKHHRSRTEQPQFDLGKDRGTRKHKQRHKTRLPLPSTQLLSRSLHLSKVHRRLAAGIVVTLGVTVAVSLVGMLSDQLEKLASKVETQNELILGPRRSRQSEKTDSVQMNFRYGRSLSARGELTKVSPENSSVEQTQPPLFLLSIMNSFHTITRITSALRRHPGFSFSVLLLDISGVKLTGKARGYGSSFTDYTGSTDTVKDKRPPQGNTPKLTRELLLAKLRNQQQWTTDDREPLGQVKSEEKVRLILKLPKETQSSDSTQIGLKEQMKEVVRGNPTWKQVSREQKDSQPRKDDAPKTANKSLRPSITKPILTIAPRSEHSAEPTVARVSQNQPQAGPNISTNNYETLLFSYEGVQAWELSPGKFLCRIYNIGRTSGGVFILPDWLQRHSDFLSSKCGVKNAVFGLESVAGENLFKMDGRALDLLGSNSLDINFTHRDLDLIGTRAPRDHMPHFVTDILLPLVASETLQGSAKKGANSSLLLSRESGKGQMHLFSRYVGIKPALLLQKETWNRSATDWVPSLARLFQNSAVGFTLIRSHEPEPLDRDASTLLQAKTQIAVFRSVITSNLNVYEPYGLFGADGNNFVFASNGISRYPPWTMAGMSESPCRVVVTVLTRKGPRALMRIQALESKIKSTAMQEGLRIDLNVVEFSHVPFARQVATMQRTNILVATHGAGNSNFIFMRPASAVVEVFPFSYKAGPFDSFAKIFDLQYISVMSAPQTEVFKECLNRHEKNERIKRLAFSRWDKAVSDEKASPWVHRLEFEKEFGEPGKSEGMTTRMCARLQELEFDVHAVTRMTVNAAKSQCLMARHMSRT